MLSDPYRFISERCRRYRSDLFQAWLFLRKTICMTGPEATALFYDEGGFMRSGVAPSGLFGKGGVQGLDGEVHRQRKQMFLSLMAPERIERLGATAADWWRVYARKWAEIDEVVLYDEVNEILSRSVCDLAGVPLSEPDVGRRTTELMAMFDRAAALSRRTGGHGWPGGGPSGGSGA